MKGNQKISDTLGTVIPQKLEITPIQGDKVKLEFDWCEASVEEFVCRLTMVNSLGNKCECIIDRDILITALRTQPLCYNNETGKTYTVSVRGVDG